MPVAASISRHRSSSAAKPSQPAEVPFQQIVWTRASASRRAAVEHRGALELAERRLAEADLGDREAAEMRGDVRQAGQHAGDHRLEDGVGGGCQHAEQGARQDLSDHGLLLNGQPAHGLSRRPRPGRRGAASAAAGARGR